MIVVNQFHFATPIFVSNFGAECLLNFHPELYNRLRILLLGAASRFSVETGAVQPVPETDARMVDILAHQGGERQDVEAARDEEVQDFLQREDDSWLITGEMAREVTADYEALGMSDGEAPAAADPGPDDVIEELGTANYIGEPVDLLYNSGEEDDDNEDIDEPDAREETNGEDRLTDLAAYDEQLTAECQEQALQYITGWLSFQFCRTHPELGEPTGRMVAGESEIPPWLERISRGGLRVPSPQFVDLVKKFEVEFDRYHGGAFNISKEKNVIKGFTQLLSEKFPEVDVAILKKYSVFRLFCRIKYLERIRKAENRKKLESNRALRKKRQFVPDT